MEMLSLSAIFLLAYIFSTRTYTVCVSDLNVFYA